MFLICHLILQDQVSKKSRNLIGGSPFKISHHPTKFGCHRPCDNVDIMYLVCHLT